MSDYSSAQIMQMQQDAVRRVHEMQRIARERVSVAPSAPPPVSRQEKLPAAELSLPSQEEESPRRSMPGGLSPLRPNALKGIISNLGLEQDQLILAGIILMLINEGADNLLIMALCYILL